MYATSSIRKMASPFSGGNLYERQLKNRGNRGMDLGADVYQRVANPAYTPLPAACAIVPGKVSKADNRIAERKVLFNSNCLS